MPWSPGETRGPPSGQPRCPPAPRAAGGLQAGEMGFRPGVGAVEGSNPEVGPRVQEGEGVCPGWELWPPELQGGPVGAGALGDGQAAQEGGPRQTRPNCTVSEGAAEEDPSAGRLRRKGAPGGPSPGPRCVPEGAESAVRSLGPQAVSAPGPAPATCKQVGYGEGGVPQSQVFARRSGPAHRAWTHMVRSASLGGAHSDGFRERLTGHEALQDPNIFLERKSGSVDPTVAQAESWDPADSPAGHGLEGQTEGVTRGFRTRQEEREDGDVLEVTLGCGAGRRPSGSLPESRRRAQSLGRPECPRLRDRARGRREVCARRLEKVSLRGKSARP